MTKLNINTNVLRDNVETSLREVSMALKSVKESAASISITTSFDGSEMIASLPSDIERCIAGINATVNWYDNCCNNYDHFSDDSINDVDSLEVDKLKPKDFKIEK
jgi:hypothetical protein